MISVICSTNRKESNSLAFARAIIEILDSQREKCQLLNLEDLPKDFIFENEVFGAINDELVKIQDTYLTNSNKYIFILPEYNGSFPGVVKAFIDSSAPSRLHNKKALLIGISSGRAGNVRGLEHFTGVLNYLRINVFPFKPAISSCHEGVENNKVTNEHYLSLLENSVNEFLVF
ncbi:MAG: NADPH-dependent FMN reductase [Salibacteraceae bacterium]